MSVFDLHKHRGKAENLENRASILGTTPLYWHKGKRLKQKKTGEESILFHTKYTASIQTYESHYTK
jgi:hypothetical protein